MFRFSLLLKLGGFFFWGKKIGSLLSVYVELGVGLFMFERAERLNITLVEVNEFAWARTIRPNNRKFSVLAEDWAHCQQYSH